MKTSRFRQFALAWAPTVMTLMLTPAAGAAPVKTRRTLVTDALVAQWRADKGMRRLVMKGDACYFCAAGGRRPAETWVEKSDEWLWRLMLPTTIRRTYCVGNDHHSPEKLGCPVHGRSVYRDDAYYPWIVDCENLPGKIKCPVGGETYPSNDFASGDLTSGDCPDDGSGCVIEGRRYHFIGLYAHYAYNTGVVPGVRSLSRAYTLTGDPRYAHKAAVLLLRVASEYPNATDRRDRTFRPGYKVASGMVTDVNWAAFALNAYASAYDELFEAIAADRQLLEFVRPRIPGVESCADMLEYIEDRLFRPGIRALMDQCIRPNIGWGQETMATLGLLLSDYGDKRPNTPDAMEWLYYSEDGKLKHMGNNLLKDGSSYESTTYNRARQSFVKVGEMVAVGITGSGSGLLRAPGWVSTSATARLGRSSERRKGSAPRPIVATPEQTVSQRMFCAVCFMIADLPFTRLICPQTIDKIRADIP